MASRKLVERSRIWLNSLSQNSLNRHCEANNGQHTRQLRAKSKRINSIWLKDDMDNWYEADAYGNRINK